MNFFLEEEFFFGRSNFFFARFFFHVIKLSYSENGSIL